MATTRLVRGLWPAAVVAGLAGDDEMTYEQANG
jgi:hypothetical protein